MFGNNVSDAIMKDLLLPQYGFSIPLNQVATWMIVSCFLYPRRRRAGRAHPVTHTIGHQPHSQVRLVLPTRKFLPTNAARATLKLTPYPSHQLNLTVEALLGINSVPPPPHAHDHKNKPSLAAEQDPMESAYTITTGAFPVQPVDEDAPTDYVRSEKRKTVMRVVARGGVTAACVVVAILLPGFGRLMAFLGSFTTFCICVLLPVSRDRTVSLGLHRD